MVTLLRLGKAIRASLMAKRRTRESSAPLVRSERDGINPGSKPTGIGCVECLALGGWWFHLRRCAECGHIGCCDNSPNQHAAKHNIATGHSIITSFEPGERWFYDYRTKQFFAGPKLRTPRSHPWDQPAPGPAGGVPSNWHTLLDEWAVGSPVGTSGYCFFRPTEPSPNRVGLFHPWKREKSPASHASRSPGALKSQSGRISRVTARRSCQRSATDGRPQNQ